jgi:hypothetical protein
MKYSKLEDFNYKLNDCFTDIYVFQMLYISNHKGPVILLRIIVCLQL